MAALKLQPPLKDRCSHLAKPALGFLCCREERQGKGRVFLENYRPATLPSHLKLTASGNKLILLRMCHTTLYAEDVLLISTAFTSDVQQS